MHARASYNLEGNLIFATPSRPFMAHDSAFPSIRISTLHAFWKPRRGAFCKTGCVSCQKSVASLFYAASLGMATPHKRASMGSPRPSAVPAPFRASCAPHQKNDRDIDGYTNCQYPYRCKVGTEIYMWAATAAEIIFCRRSISSPGRVFLLWKSMSASVVMGMRWMWAWGTSRPITASPMRLQGTA